MKGKNIFTLSEKDKIEKLLIELRSGILQPQQKKVRRELRNMEFYISDFSRSSKGFTRSDFCELIENNRIKIIE